MMLYSTRNLDFNSQAERKNSVKHSMEPTYAKQSCDHHNSILSKTDLQNPETQRSRSIHSIKSRGLSLSIKGSELKRLNSLSSNTATTYDRGLQNSSFLRSKISNLTRTCHSIRNLKGSQSKAKCQQIQSTRKHAFMTPQSQMETGIRDFEPTGSFNQKVPMTISQIISPQTIEQSSYHIRVVEPSLQVLEKNKSYLFNSFGKPTQIRRKQFLRGKSQARTQQQHLQGRRSPQQVELIDNSVFLGRSTRHAHSNKTNNTSARYGAQLQKYIQKSLESSIALVNDGMKDLNPGMKDRLLKQESEQQKNEPESPFLRLRNRLKVNKINCIFEKQTIVSHISHEVQSSNKSSLHVEESIIVHRNISGNFAPLTHKLNIFNEGDQLPYKLYLGLEKVSGMVFTIKQMPLCQFERFAAELLLYQELESSGVCSEQILGLVKFSTDSDMHIVVKEPYTETISDFLENLIAQRISQVEFESETEQMVNSVRVIIENLQSVGIYLKNQVYLQDFVYCFEILKVENLSNFQIGNAHKVDLDMTLECLREEIQMYMHRVSAGSFEL